MEIVATRIVGQPDALKEVERCLKIAQAGLRGKRPLGKIMLAGPTGTGKSELAKALAFAIHGDEDLLCRVNCNQLKEHHSTASLTGSPPGYIGSASGDSILNKELIEGADGFPGILVLEEYEKAHENVWEAFLGVFTDGELQLNNGKGKIDFTNTIILMTSNVGARDLNDATRSGIGFTVSGRPAGYELTADRRFKIVHDEIKLVFPPEQIGRWDSVVVFGWLTQADVEKITWRNVGDLGRRLEPRGHKLIVSPAAISFIAERGFDPRKGARYLNGAIDRWLVDPLSEAIVDGLPYVACTIYVRVVPGGSALFFKYKERIIVRPRPAKPPPELPVATGSDMMPYLPPDVPSTPPEDLTE
jgi:ATP-dependent Clp protease ATP-binding subunit ClpA